MPIAPEGARCFRLIESNCLNSFAAFGLTEPITRECTVEVKGQDKPVLIAEWVGVVYV